MSPSDRAEILALAGLIEGQYLDQATFHERYATMPEGAWAELVGGVVQVLGRVLHEHGQIVMDLAGWLGWYQRSTPGAEGLKRVSTVLGPWTEVHPDIQLRRTVNSGSRVVDGYIVGPPELIVEVAGPSRAFDLGPKKDD